MNKDIQENIRVNLVKGQWEAIYDPSEEDFNPEEREVFNIEKMRSFRAYSSNTSFFSFLSSWITKKWVWITGAGIAIFSLLKGVDNPLLNWLGESVIGNTLNLELTTLASGQKITLAMTIFGAYLSYFLLTQVIKIPNLLNEQREDEKLQARKNLISRILEYKKHQIKSFEIQQNLHDFANKLFEKQIEINAKSRELLIKVNKNVVDYEDFQVKNEIFSRIKGVVKKTGLLESLNM